MLAERLHPAEIDANGRLKVNGVNANRANPEAHTTEMHEKIKTIVTESARFLDLHSVPAGTTLGNPDHVGNYALQRGEKSADLYGMIDAVYILHILGRLAEESSPASRAQWADAILACQDDQGYFSRKNKRGHSAEHATAYAIGALHLLEIAPTESYVAQVQPLHFAEPLLQDRHQFVDWIEHLGFRYRLQDVLHKNVGWNHIWRSSHIGGGVAAALQMTQQSHEQWWGNAFTIEPWFAWYFDWLNEQINPRTGLWQRALWNYFYKEPTLIDMGGAVHFFWIYDALGKSYPYPTQTIDATIGLQKGTGLYKEHPFCIDLDGNFCIIRPYLQLQSTEQSAYANRVYSAVEANFIAIVDALTTKPLAEIYQDSHGLPGALAALVECTQLPDFPYTTALKGWQNPFDRVCWL